MVLFPSSKSISHAQKQLKTGTETLGRDEKLSVLKDCLAAVGRRIDVVVEEKAVCGLDAEKWRKHLWV